MILNGQTFFFFCSNIYVLGTSNSFLAIFTPILVYKNLGSVIVCSLYVGTTCKYANLDDCSVNFYIEKNQKEGCCQLFVFKVNP